MADVFSSGATLRRAMQMIPAEIGKALSPAEIGDRLAEAQRLADKAMDPSVPQDLRNAYKLRAAAVLKARPRAEVEAERAELVRKAEMMPNSQGDALREQARRLTEEEHPIAPRRTSVEARLEGIRQRHRVAVGKAKKSDKAAPMPVFDQAGNLVGVIDPDDLLPVIDPDDLLPVAGPEKKAGAAADAAPAQPAAAAPADAQPVAKAWRTTVFDQHGRRYVADGRNIRRSAVRKAADDLITLYDSAGRPYQVSRSAIQTPEEQARNTGPVNAGGTTGMGQPRMTGPASALPGDGPQARLRGDVAGRTVVKAAGWTDVHDYRGVRVGIVKQADVIAAGEPAAVLDQVLRRPGYAAALANVYNSAGRRTGLALVGDILPVRPGGR